MPPERRRRRRQQQRKYQPLCVVSTAMGTVLASIIAGTIFVVVVVDVVVVHVGFILILISTSISSSTIIFPSPIEATTTPPPTTTTTLSSTSSANGGTSRAYPLGCRYRHPLYYTYDERDEIIIPIVLPTVVSTETKPNHHHDHHHHHHHDNYSINDKELSNKPTITTTTKMVGWDHVDFRTLPKKSSQLRHNYNQYRIIRLLGSGKFSEVFEAVDLKKEWKRRQRHQHQQQKEDQPQFYNHRYSWRQQKQQQQQQQQQQKQRVTRQRRQTNPDHWKRKRKRVEEEEEGEGEEQEQEENDDGDDNDDTEDENQRMMIKGSNIQYHHSRNVQQQQQQHSLVVLKCLKPISERKIRRELLVLTHCHTLPNVAKLIGILIPQSMDGEMEVNSNSNSSNNKKDDGGNNNATSVVDPCSTKNNNNNEKTILVAEHRQGTMTAQTRNHTRYKLHEQQHYHLPVLVLEHAGPNSQYLCHNAPQRQPHYSPYLSEYEIKYYLCHLLIALDGLHSAGIMHRDVKPRNMLINRRSLFIVRGSNDLSEDDYHDYDNDDGNGSYDSNVYDDDHESILVSSPQRRRRLQRRRRRQQRQIPSPHPIPLMLVDLGLADFYHPHKSYNVRVASRHYKSPELLIGYTQYDYAIDLWSVGCIFAGLLFRKEPFFHGKDNDDQLGRIVSVLGVQDFLTYRRKCGVRLSASARAAIGKYCWKSSTSATLTSILTSSSSSSLSSSSSSEDEDSQSMVNNDMRYRKPWHAFLSSDCPVPCPAAFDLLDKLLVYDHEQRWTAKEAIYHEFFEDVREKVFEEIREWKKNQQRNIIDRQCSLSNPPLYGR